jgi:hypothetical protein
MGGELEELRALSKPRKGPPCGFSAVGLDGAANQALLSGLNDPAITAKAISAFLAKRGIAVSFWTIARHRRAECACAR